MEAVLLLLLMVWSASGQPIGEALFTAPPPNEAVEEQAKTLAENEVLFVADDQAKERTVYHLRGNVEIRTTTARLTANSVDYDEEKAVVEAEGSIYYRNLSTGEELWAERLVYDLNAESGKFYDVKGRAQPNVSRRQGILYTEMPFLFEGEWAEKTADRYVLHDGYLTNCEVPKPWWKLQGPRFEIVPGKRAIATRSTFYLKGVPLFYSPYFYKSLKREERRSGFLTPNIGNSSRMGRMVGAGYYWAISRSLDFTYRGQYFSQRGLAHLADLRGRPTHHSEFNFNIYAVDDRGLKLANGEVRDESGWYASFQGKTDLPGGWKGKAEINALSSFLFRQAFTQTFTEAVASQVNSIAYATRQWENLSLDVVFTRQENYQSIREGDRVLIRKLPQIEFRTRNLKLAPSLPIWFSLDSSASLMRRKQPLFETRQFSDRVDFAPRVFTAFHIGDFHIVPSAGITATRYGQRREELRLTGENLLRTSQDFAVEIIPPSLERIYTRKTFFGEKLKHVIEPRLLFRTVRGIDHFDNVILFDETDLRSNTAEAEVSLTQRFYAKKPDGHVEEVLSWQLWQRRYFDQDFGGAITPGARNTLAASLDLTPYAFLDAPRKYSPLVSAVRFNPIHWLGVTWRSDYDSRRGRIVNNEVNADIRFAENYLVSMGHNQVRSVPIRALGLNEFLGLSPNANQFRGLFAAGDPDRRGWNAAFSAVYDFRQAILQFSTTQVTYNTDCCGFSVQYRRFSFGTRDENQFRFQFAVANIGVFGNLRKQERLF